MVEGVRHDMERPAFRIWQLTRRRSSPLTPPEPGAAELGTGHHGSSGNGACCPGTSILP